MNSLPEVNRLSIQHIYKPTIVYFWIAKTWLFLKTAEYCKHFKDNKAILKGEKYVYNQQSILHNYWTLVLRKVPKDK